MIKIGVTGTFCSGKDSFAEYLKARGFIHISLSDMLREELRKKVMEISRDNLQTLGNSMRAKEGSSVLAKRAIAKMSENKEKNYIITSIRNPFEVKELAKSENFVLVNIDAPAEIRFQRLITRTGREDKEPKTFEEFIAKENEELNPEKESDLNIRDCMKMARVTIINDSDFETFKKKIEEALPKIEEMANFRRPSWDEYFIEMMKVVGKRGTCDRGRSGCVIVKNKRVMCTGYVGSPVGLAHCDEVGHWFKKTIHEDGSITQHCIRTVHAEANAIAQAARTGINIDGATLYCKMEPCLDCTKLLISAGIKRVVCEKRYHAAKESREMLQEAGIQLEVVEDSVEKYEGQSVGQIK